MSRPRLQGGDVAHRIAPPASLATTGDTCRTWLIAYDVRDPRRLARVGRAAARAALRLNLSLYAVDLTEAGRDRLSARLGRLIDPAVDDLRFYPVPEPPVGAWLGPTEPSDALLLGPGASNLVARLARQDRRFA